MKLSKHVEGLTSENCLDKISNLPDELLGHILSFLPTRFAVSTSILSRRWQYLFTLATCLSFQDVEQYDRTELTEVAPRFKEFVDKVLELHQVSPIKKFSLLCRTTYDNSDLKRWVTHALEKGVQELHYELWNWNWIHCMPDGVFMCETLVKLEMRGFGYTKIEIPPSASLPKLRILHLSSILFVDFNSMENLFSKGELLQKLTLKRCCCNTNGHATLRSGILKVLTIRNCSFELGTFEINAPNLSYLKYTSNEGVKIVPSWEKSCSAYGDIDTSEDSHEYDRELLNAAAYKATKVRFKSHVIELFFQLDEEHKPGFPSLSCVRVDKCPYNAWEYVTSLMDKSPQLETVVFESCFPCCGYCAYYHHPDECYCNPQSPSDIPKLPFSCSVQVIEVHNLCGYDRGPLSLMEHLLTNASRLKRFFVHIVNGPEHDLENDLELKYLLMLPRASKDCHVEIKFGSGNTTLISTDKLGGQGR